MKTFAFFKNMLQIRRVEKVNGRTPTKSFIKKHIFGDEPSVADPAGIMTGKVVWYLWFRPLRLSVEFWPASNYRIISMWPIPTGSVG